jgi:hypothetical protein
LAVHSLAKGPGCPGRWPPRCRWTRLIRLTINPRVRDSRSAPRCSRQIRAMVLARIETEPVASVLADRSRVEHEGRTGFVPHANADPEGQLRNRFVVGEAPQVKWSRCQGGHLTSCSVGLAQTSNCASLTADPDRKGKVQSGIGHAQMTPLRGMRFEGPEEARAYLDQCERRRTDIPKTTRAEHQYLNSRLNPPRFGTFFVRNSHVQGMGSGKPGRYAKSSEHRDCDHRLDWRSISLGPRRPECEERRTVEMLRNSSLFRVVR